MTLRLIGIIATSIGAILLAIQFFIDFKELEIKIAKNIPIRESDVNRLLLWEGGIIVFMGFIIFFIKY